MARVRVAHVEGVGHSVHSVGRGGLALASLLVAGVLLAQGCAGREGAVPPFDHLVAVHGVPEHLGVTRSPKANLLTFEMRYSDAYGATGGPRAVRVAAGDGAALEAELERDPGIVTIWVENGALAARRGDSTLVAWQLARGDRVLLSYAQTKAGEEAGTKVVLPLAGIAVLGLAAFLWNLRGTQRK